jgi:uncharacterized Tic20 family protein
MQPPYPPPARIADKSAERALAALAYGAIAFGLFGITLPISLLVAGIIWLYSKRSPEVRFHSEQAGCYQCSVLLINILWVVILGLGGGWEILKIVRGEGDPSIAGWVIIGIMLFVVWFFASIIYGIIAAIFVLLGKRFKYPIIGSRFEKRVW